MAENEPVVTPTEGGNAPQNEGKLTQAEVDAIVEDRLARERKKYANYSDLKKASEELAELKKSQMSEAEKLKAALEEKEKTLADLRGKLTGYELKEIKLAKLIESGVNPEWMDSVTGSTEEEITASVSKIAARLNAVPPKTPTGANGAGNPGVRPNNEPSIDDQIRELEKAVRADPNVQPRLTALKLKKQAGIFK